MNHLSIPTTRLPFGALALLVGCSLLPAQITPGNLVVLRVGDGAAALGSAASPTFYEQMSTAGVPVSTLALPTAVSGANRRCTNSGSATSEGFLTQSFDGRFLVSAGYDADPSTPAVAGTASATVARVAARVALDGSIDTSTAVTDGYNTSNVRSATSNDGSDIWLCGNGASGTGGVRYAALGGSTSVQLSSTVTNLRVTNIFGGQLYCSSASGAFQGVSAVGSGLPTTSGQTTTLLPGFPTASGPSSYDYFFADASTLYVADDRATAGGGIQKWLLISGTWTLQYTLQPAGASGTGTVGCRGLTGEVVGGVATLYATTTETSANRVVKVTDTGAASTYSLVSTAAANTAYRGLRLVRCPSARVDFFGTGTAHTAGTPQIGATANFTLGASVGVTANGMLPSDVAVFVVGLRIPPIDLSLSGAQPGSLFHLYILDYVGLPTDGTGAATWNLTVPTDTALCGGELSWQMIQIDFALPYSLPVALSQGMTTRVGI
ncbi:MAG: hypothetical protein U1F36_22050 [Planctomycetota bacterium]